MTSADEVEIRIWVAGHLTFQIFDARTKAHLNFCMETDHPELMKEAFCLLQEVILHE